MTVTALNKVDAQAAADRHEQQLADAYQQVLAAAGRTAAHRFRQTAPITAAATPKDPKQPNWTPPNIDELVNLEQIAAQTAKKTAPIHRKALGSVGDAYAAAGISFDVTNPLALTLLGQIGGRSGDVAKSVRDDLAKIIGDAYTQGLSVNKTAEQIVTLSDQFSQAQSKMLARTDLNGIANGGSHLAAKEVFGDGGGYKTWLTAADDLVRPTHADADGQTVPIDEQFDVGGESADYPGDPQLSDAEACNCRCTLTYSETVGDGSSAADISAAGGPDVSNLAMVAVYPHPSEAEAIALPDGHPPEKMHVTLVFLGAADTFNHDDVRAALAQVANASEPLSGSVGGVGRFATGPDGAPLIALPYVKGLSALRESVASALSDRGIESPSEHGWTPHLTLDYTQDDAMPPTDCLGAPLSFSTLSLAIADQRQDFPLAATSVSAAGGISITSEGGDMGEAQITIPLTLSVGSATTNQTGNRSSGGIVLAPSIEPSVDPFAAPPPDDDADDIAVATSHAYLDDGNGSCMECGMGPDAQIHDTLVAAGEVPTFEQYGSAMKAQGYTPWQTTLCVEGVPTVDNGTKRMLALGGGTWKNPPIPIGIIYDSPHARLVSEAPICARADYVWRDGNEIKGMGVFTLDDVGQKAATYVGGDFITGMSIDPVDVEFEPMMYANGAAVSLPDAVDLPSPTDPLEDYDVINVFKTYTIAGATICPVQALTDATISLLAGGDGRLSNETRWDLGDALTASAVEAEPPLCPPAAWFDDPQLDRPTLVTVTDDGRVFGHVAPWRGCHTGYAGRCVPPPRSRTGYAHFHVGRVETAEGALLPIGKLTLASGHASINDTSAAARRHYDNSAAVAAFVRAGEDAHGIWIAGALRPGVSPSEIQDLLANPLSGDWRNGEMVAAHAVPVPGFPILQASAIGEDGGEETALILTSTIGLLDDDPGPVDFAVRSRVLAARARGGVAALAELARS